LDITGGNLIVDPTTLVLPKATDVQFGSISFPSGPASSANGDLDKATSDGNAVIKSNAVTTAKILNSNVTYSKIQPVTANKVLGAQTTGTVTEIGMGSGLRMDSSKLAVNFPEVAVSSNMTLLSGNTHYSVNTSAALTLTLPSPATVTGELIIIKDVSGSATTNNITITGGSGILIDNATTLIISTNYGAVVLYSNGTNYYISTSTYNNSLGIASAYAGYNSLTSTTFASPALYTLNIPAISSPASPLVNLTVDSSGVFTVQRAGRYRVSFNTSTASASTAANAYCHVAKNNIIVASSNITYANFFSYNQHVEWIGSLAVNDNVRIKVQFPTNTVTCFYLNFSIVQLPLLF
jgi:hypothetical protein